MNKPLPRLEEESDLEKGIERITPANEAFICSYVPERYPTIKILTKALRRHPRRSQRVLEVSSPSILKRMSSLVPYPYILWTTMSSWVVGAGGYSYERGAAEAHLFVVASRYSSEGVPKGEQGEW